MAEQGIGGAAEWIPLREAVARSGIHQAGLLKLHRWEQITARRDGRAWFVDQGSLRAYLQRQDASAQVGGAYAPRPLARLFDAILGEKTERAIVEEQIAAARAAGDFSRAIALEDCVAILHTMTVAWDEASREWRITFGRPFPSLDAAPTELVPA